jgi:hypothetical protein
MPVPRAETHACERAPKQSGALTLSNHLETVELTVVRREALIVRTISAGQLKISEPDFEANNGTNSAQALSHGLTSRSLSLEGDAIDKFYGKCMAHLHT